MERGMQRGIVAGVILGALVLGVVASCAPKKESKSTEELEVRREDTVLVRTAPAEIMNLVEVERYTGVVQPFEESQICPGIPARIRRVHVDVGDRVRQGQLLVEMDPTQLLTLRAQYTTLLQDFNRLDTLYRVGSVSKQAYDQMKTQVEVLGAQVRNMEENTRLLSPIDGVVTAKHFNEGEIFSMAPTPSSAGRAAILTVMQLNPVKVRVSPPEDFYPRIKEGSEVEVTVNVYGDTKFSGRIFRKFPTINPVAHTFDLEVTAVNADGRLRPGMYARVKIPFGRIDRAMVPDLAVQHQRGTNERFIFVAEEGVARRVTVVLGDRYKNLIEIKQGLTGQERVIVSGIKQLQNGSPIREVE